MGQKVGNNSNAIQAQGDVHLGLTYGEVKENHGCQIVINGVIPSLKYYFRLIDNIEDFISIYSELIEKDTELKISHKKKWAELLNRLES